MGAVAGNGGLGMDALELAAEATFPVGSHVRHAVVHPQDACTLGSAGCWVANPVPQPEEMIMFLQGTATCQTTSRVRTILAGSRANPAAEKPAGSRPAHEAAAPGPN